MKEITIEKMTAKRQNSKKGHFIYSSIAKERRVRNFTNDHKF